MTENAPNEDRDTFIIAEKRAALALLCIVLTLLAYMMTAYIQQPTVKEAVSLQTTAPTVPPPASNKQEIAIAFSVGGRIAQMFVAEHSQVKKGDVLASLDKAPFEEALALAQVHLQAATTEYNKPVVLSTSTFHTIEEARANVETAQHNYDAAHTELEKRKQSLVVGQTDNVYDDDVQNEHDAEVALQRAQRELTQQENVATNDIDRSVEKSAIEAARNDVAIAQTNLAGTQLVAPADGIISSRVVEIGATVPVGAAVYILSIPATPDHIK